MKKVLFGALTIAVAIGWVLTGGVNALVGAPHGDTVNYSYAGSSSTDSGTCGNDWANDTMTRNYKVYPEQTVGGSYRVVETFTNGKFTTIAGQSPERCEAGTSNSLAAGKKGTFHGSFVIKVDGGSYTPGEDVSCAAGCTTAQFIAAAFGGSATYNVSDYYFKYKVTGSAFCAKQWVNAATGNAGDIATSCAP
jgi:hypothetical protein